jgi:HK97 family phage prohead protease
MENSKDYILSIKDAERRYVEVEMKAEKRSMGEGDDMEEELYITGYAAKINNETNLGNIREMIMPGAFDEALQDDVRVLKNHDENYIVGRTLSKTAEIGVDGIGLWYRARIDKRNSDHMNLYYSVERGDISQSSFAFSVKEQAFEKGEGMQPNLRKIVKVSKLYDVSPVTYPAYANTSINTNVALRSMSAAMDVIEEDYELESMRMKAKLATI